MENATLQTEKIEPPLTRDIMRYYMRNPNVADTLEGLARWRLLEQTVHETVSEVQEAVNWLVSQGLLRKILRLSSPPLFELNRDRLDECKQYLKKSPSGAQGAKV
jgi:hypothetical protein